MARQTAWVLALVLTCAPALAAAGHANGQQGRPEKAQGLGKDSQKDKPQPAASRGSDDRERWKWWLYDRAELGITDQQSMAINQIFESTMPKLREVRQEMDRAEEELSRAVKEHKADLGTISILIDRVESARSQWSKDRVLMLYRMHLLLSAEQRTKLEALRARQDAARKGREQAQGHGRRP